MFCVRLYIPEPQKPSSKLAASHTASAFGLHCARSVVDCLSLCQLSTGLHPLGGGGPDNAYRFLLLVLRSAGREAFLEHSRHRYGSVMSPVRHRVC